MKEEKKEKNEKHKKSQNLFSISIVWRTLDGSEWPADLFTVFIYRIYLFICILGGTWYLVLREVLYIV